MTTAPCPLGKFTTAAVIFLLSKEKMTTLYAVSPSVLMLWENAVACLPASQPTVKVTFPAGIWCDSDIWKCLKEKVMNDRPDVEKLCGSTENIQTMKFWVPYYLISSISNLG